MTAIPGRSPLPFPLTGVEHEGYTGRYEIDPDEGVLHGHVDGIEDIVTFVADDLSGLQREFRISVDEYLQYRAERGIRPNRPFASPDPHPIYPTERS